MYKTPGGDIEVKDHDNLPPLPIWTKKECPGGHVHIEVVSRLQDGTCVTYFSPGLDDDDDLHKDYLIFVSSYLEETIPFESYVSHEKFPHLLSVPESPNPPTHEQMVDMLRDMFIVQFEKHGDREHGPHDGERT
ncbi:MAG: hypothetical protein ACJ8BW_00915 [Ktedonobacteraceae bacterium]